MARTYDSLIAHGMLVFGLSTYLCMLRPPFFASLLLDIDGGVILMRSCYYLGIAVLGVVFMYVSTRRRIVAIPASLLCACTIANVIGITVIVGMQVVEVSVPVLAIAAVLGICLGFVALTWGWMDVLGKLDVGEATFACLLAFVLSHLFGFVDLLPRMAAAVISASYPAFSCMSIWQCLESQGLRSFEGVPLAGRFLSERAAEGKDWSYKAGLVALLLIVTVIVSSAFLRSIYSSGAMTYDPTAKVVPVYLVSLVVGTLIMLVIARWGEKARCALALGIASLAFFLRPLRGVHVWVRDVLDSRYNRALLDAHGVSAWIGGDCPAQAARANGNACEPVLPRVRIGIWGHVLARAGRIVVRWQHSHPVSTGGRAFRRTHRLDRDGGDLCGADRGWRFSERGWQ
jgi:hypothetical protein